MAERTQFLQFIHNIRGVAILFVVMAHCITIVDIGQPLLVKGVVENAAVVFVAIAGYLFSLLMNRYTYLTYLEAKLKYVVLPYIIMSIPAILIYLLKIKTTHSWLDMEWFYSQGMAIQYLYLMITGAHLGPMWFVPMVITIYVLFPVVKCGKDYGLLIPLFLLSLLAALYLGRPSLNSNILQAAIYYFPAYVGGVLCASEQGIYSKFSKHSLTVAIAFSILWVIAIYTANYDSRWDLVFKLALFWVLLVVGEKYLNFTSRPLGALANASFPIVYVHGYFIGAIRLMSEKSIINLSGYIEFIIAFISVVALSYMSYAAIRRVARNYSKYILGA